MTPASEGSITAIVPQRSENERRGEFGLASLRSPIQRRILSPHPSSQTSARPALPGQGTAPVVQVPLFVVPSPDAVHGRHAFLAEAGCARRMVPPERCGLTAPLLSLCLCAALGARSRSRRFVRTSTPAPGATDGLQYARSIFDYVGLLRGHRVFGVGGNEDAVTGSDDPVDVLLVIDMQYPGYDIDRDVVGVAVGWGFFETSQVPEVERVAGGAYMLDFAAGTYLRGFRFDVDDACLGAFPFTETFRCAVWRTQ